MRIVFINASSAILFPKYPFFPSFLEYFVFGCYISYLGKGTPLPISVRWRIKVDEIYKPEIIEPKWQDYWEKEKFLKSR